MRLVWQSNFKKENKEKERKKDVLRFCVNFDAVVGCSLDTPGLDQSNRCMGTETATVSTPPSLHGCSYPTPIHLDAP